ncbi:helix-turn-helix domain-containing protein [Streptomyces sp. NPDC054919]
MNQVAGAPGRSSFGRLLRELRQSRGLTMEELAEASGVSGRATGDMERGRSLRPHRGAVTALAQGLRLDEAAHDGLLAAARAARPATKTSLGAKAWPCAWPRTGPQPARTGACSTQPPGSPTKIAGWMYSAPVTCGSTRRSPCPTRVLLLVPPGCSGCCRRCRQAISACRWPPSSRACRCLMPKTCWRNYWRRDC